MTLGDRIKRIREKKELSQSELAKFLGIAQSTYSQYESGDRRMPDDLKIKFADRFNVSTDYLLGRPEVSNQLHENKSYYGEGSKLIELYKQLNQEGQEKALDYLIDLASSGRYKKDNPTPMVQKKA
jgi:Predicted transcriptional regulators